MTNKIEEVYALLGMKISDAVTADDECYEATPQGLIDSNEMLDYRALVKMITGTMEYGIVDEIGGEGEILYKRELAGSINPACHVSGKLDGKAVLDAAIAEAKLRQSITGRNPFEL